MSDLIWHRDPGPLRAPLLLVALEGFVDAGAAAATAATFLRHRWQADQIATFDKDAFIDFRARRPTVVIDAGEVRRLEWPSIDVYAAEVSRSERDVVLVIGSEPDMRWEAFADAVLRAAQRLGAATLVTLGSYPAAVPHTRPIRLMRAHNGRAGSVEIGGTPVPGYTGPINVGTALQEAAKRIELSAVGLWAEVPHYIAASPNPAAALTLARAVTAALGVDLDATELEAAATAHREQVDAAVADHADAQGMVEALERHLDLGEDDAEMPSGEDLADEIERFLRSQPE